MKRRIRFTRVRFVSPSAALLAALLLSAAAGSRTLAQYPGGGGYPGGGSQSVQGWKPVLRTGASSTTPGADDHTGFNFTSTLLYMGSTTPSNNSGTLFGGLGPPNTQGVGGTFPNVAEWSYSIAGNPATYKWEWTPPNKADGTPDLDNFPVPALFTFGSFQPTIYFHATDQSNKAGLLGRISASVSATNWNWSWASSTSATLLTSPDIDLPAAQLPSRGIVPTTIMASVATMTVTPAGAITVKGTAAATGVAHIAAVRVTPKPIVLSAPNPFGRPFDGDGTNQYTYDIGSPNGRIRIPAGVATVGDEADHAWLVRDGSPTPSQPTPSQPTWSQIDWEVAPATLGTLLPYTVTTLLTPNTPLGGGQVSDRLVFQGTVRTNRFSQQPCRA